LAKLHELLIKNIMKPTIARKDHLIRKERNLKGKSKIFLKALPNSYFLLDFWFSDFSIFPFN